MPEPFNDFARDCRAVAKAMRALPAEVKKELQSELKDKVAEPLAAKVAQAARGKWARPLSLSVKVRAGVDPTIVVGGTRSLVSGGATGRQLIFGTEFGGGNRVSTVNRPPGKRGRVARGERGTNGRGVYKRHTTKQFSPATPFVFETVEANAEWAVEQFAEIVMRKVVNALSE
jgi:hypothetical protein